MTLNGVLHRARGDKAARYAKIIGWSIASRLFSPTIRRLEDAVLSLLTFWGYFEYFEGRKPKQGLKNAPGIHCQSVRLSVSSRQPLHYKAMHRVSRRTTNASPNKTRFGVSSFIEPCKHTFCIPNLQLCASTRSCAGTASPVELTGFQALASACSLPSANHAAQAGSYSEWRLRGLDEA